MTTSFCGSCGRRSEDGERFCAACGTPLVAPATTPTAPAAPSRATVRPTPPPLPPLAPLHSGPPLPPPPLRPRSDRPWTRVLGAVAVGVAAALLVGWAAHYLPTSSPGEVSAAGVRADDDAGVDGPDGADEAVDGEEGAEASPETAPGSDAALTSFVTTCGRVLDVVPTAAVASGAALQITLELRPVCEVGEWVASRSLRVELRDDGGVPLATGTFDFSRDRLFVPGYADPVSRLTASFGRGTAWSDPDTVARNVADGSIQVDCEALDGSAGEPASAEDLGGTTEPVEHRASAAAPRRGADTEETALAALRRQVAADDASVSELEGSWVPQLSSKTAGTYDPYDKRSYTLTDVYQQFLALRLTYPNVRLLSSTEWNSYTLDGYWVVIAGVPFIRANQPNRWCNERSIPPTQCFAKQLVRDGAPEGTIKHRG